MLGIEDSLPNLAKHVLTQRTRERDLRLGLWWDVMQCLNGFMFSFT